MFAHRKVLAASATPRRLLHLALVTLLVVAAAPVSAQVSQAARNRASAARVATVHYQVLWRTEFLSRPDTAAPVIAWLDSGQVVTPELPETFQTGHARIVVNGRRGWVDNGYIRRVVTMKETTRIVDTVQSVVRRPPARAPGDPRAPDRVSPKVRP
jgi:hypothetical protein